MKLNRRHALGLIGAGANAVAAPAMAADGQGDFRHGVASGDPLADRVIIWTRVTPKDPAQPLRVDWEVASDPDFRKVVRKGRAEARAERDHTVKVDVTGLKPGGAYHYRFRTGNAVSPTGRTLTLPGDDAQDAVLAVVSCSLYPAGYFNAYDAIARLERVDAVVHLGDYIYEYGAGPADYGMAGAAATGRTPEPRHELVSLADYRTRHAHYRTDPALQAAHARAPWIVVLDDHETANDAWTGGAENHTPAAEGDWSARKAAGLRAYSEWLPIREGASLPEGLTRAFPFGKIANLLMVDTRLSARDEQQDYANIPPGADGKPDFARFMARRAEPSRQLLGSRQEQWLEAEMTRSVQEGCAWQVLGNQVVMARVDGPDIRARLTPEQWESLMTGLPAAIRPVVEQMARLYAMGVPMNLDSWDGYPAARERVYAAMGRARASAVVLAGDSHAFWANDLHDATGRLAAVEFGTTSVTSPGWGDALPGVDIGAVIAEQNRDVVYSDQGAKGFTLLTLTKQDVVAELVAVSTITSRDYETRTLRRFRSRRTDEGAGSLQAV